jgi:hypothetical protein
MAENKDVEAESRRDRFRIAGWIKRQVRKIVTSYRTAIPTNRNALHQEREAVAPYRAPVPLDAIEISLVARHL